MVLCALATLAAGAAHAGTPALRLSEQLTPAPIADIAPTLRAHPLQLRLSGAARASLSTLVLAKAMAMLGTEYEFGGNNDDAVDCSGLMQTVFLSAGLKLPRTTGELLATGTSVRKTQLKPGDLMIYRWQPHQLHVAVYVNDGYIVHASPSVGRVIVTELDSQWRKHLVAIRRLL